MVLRGLHADYGLFTTTTPEGLLYPRPSADKIGAGLELLEFLGRRCSLQCSLRTRQTCKRGRVCTLLFFRLVGLMLGKALYEGVLLNITLAPFFISRILVGAHSPHMWTQASWCCCTICHISLLVPRCMPLCRHAALSARHAGCRAARQCWMTCEPWTRSCTGP